MAASNLHFCLWVLLVASIFGNISLYRIFYAEEECRKNGGIVTIYLGNGTDDSYGIFKASRDGRQLPEMNCHIILKPPLFSEVVISVRAIDLMPPVNCRSYLELNSSSDIRVRLCGYFYDKKEMESFFSFGDIDLIFHTTKPLNSSALEKTKMQFEIIFTAVLSKLKTKATQTKCDKDQVLCENGRCIWKGLVNDGHNNCGDLSDEPMLDTSQSNQLSAGMTLAVVIPIIVLSLALILALVCCFGHRITAKIERLIQNEERRSEASRNALINSGSSPRQNYNTGTVPRSPLQDNRNVPAPERDVTVVARVHEDWRARRSPQQPALRIATDGEKDLQLPPYDPPPSYEVATEQMKEKY